MNTLYTPDKIDKISPDEHGKVYAGNVPEGELITRDKHLHDVPQPDEPSREHKRGWLIRFLAGENKAGKIGAKVKNVLLAAVPYGRFADRITDQIGNELKEKKPKKAIMKDKKTTIFGIVTLLITVAGIFGIDLDQTSATEITSVVVGILAGFGLLSARDSKRKDEEE